MYRKKTDHQLVWQETRQDVSHVLRQISERIRNEVLAELDAEFVAALTEGKVISFDLSKAELSKRFASTANQLDKNFDKLKEIGGPNASR